MTLEQRYRAAMNWYPSSWREQNADAVVGTLMDEADATGRTRPRPAELASLAVNGIRARLHEPLAQPVRDRAAALALGMAVSLAVLSFVGSEWAPFAHSASYETVAGMSGTHVPFGPFKSLGAVVFLALITAGAASLAGRRYVAKAFLVVGVAAAVIIVEAPAITDSAWAFNTDRPAPAALLVFVLLSLVALSGTPGRLRRPLLVAAVVSSVTLAAAGALTIADWIRPGSGVAGWRGYADALDGYLPPTLILHDALSPVVWLAAFVLFALVAAWRRSWSWFAAAGIAALPWLALGLILPMIVHGSEALAAALGAFAVVAALLVALRVSGYRLQLVKRR